jgi:MFS transporter, Spinster family, sphingosine-1-phosphate transporter
MVPPSVSSAPSQTLPGARSALILLLLINLLNYIDRSVLAAVQPRISAELLSGDPDPNAKSGWLATAFLVTYMLAAPIFGLMADRMRRWLIVGLAVILWSLATGASGLAATFIMLLSTRIFVGIGEAGYGPSAPTLIADYYPLEKRGSVLAWFYMAIPVGSALGYALGGLIEPRLGWRAAFYAAVLPGIALGIVAIYQRDPPRGHQTAPRQRPRLADYLTLLRIPSYLLDTAGMTALTFAIGGISYHMPKYLEYRYHAAGMTPAVNVSTVFGGITALAGIIATLSGGWLGDRLRSRYAGSYFLVSGAAIVISAPLIVLMLYTPFPTCWGVIFLAVFFLFFNTGPANTILANVTKSAVRATAFAVNILVIHLLGDAVSPPLLGWIVDLSPGKDNWDPAFMIVAGMTAIAGLLWLLGIPHLQRDTLKAQNSQTP